MDQLIRSPRDRLLIKVAGWPWVGFFHVIFSDAKLIHVVRDGRAVANSLLNEAWWWGWRGPQNWRWGEMSAADHVTWQEHGRSFVAFTGL